MGSGVSSDLVVPSGPSPEPVAAAETGEGVSSDLVVPSGPSLEPEVCKCLS